jgi:hypothetical protein
MDGRPTYNWVRPGSPREPLQGTVIVEGRLQKWSISLYGSSVKGTQRPKMTVEMGTSFLGGHTGEPGEGSPSTGNFLN